MVQRGGKPGKWAGDGCRQRYWNQTHSVTKKSTLHALNLAGLSVVEAERAKRMAEEAVKAVREGLKRATVDVLPVKHGRDGRPSCRVRLDPSTWETITIIAELRGQSRSSFIADLVLRFMREEGGPDGQDPA